MFDKFKQLREMQKQAKEVQKVLAEEIITARRGDVEIKINGNLEVQSIKIEEINDKHELEKDIKKAMNDAIKSAQKIMAKKMMGSGMNIPGLN